MRTEHSTKVTHEEPGRGGKSGSWSIVASETGVRISYGWTATKHKERTVSDHATFSHEEARRVLEAALDCLNAYEDETNPFNGI
jgi:hypothetical protein